MTGKFPRAPKCDAHGEVWVQIKLKDLLKILSEREQDVCTERKKMAFTFGEPKLKRREPMMAEKSITNEQKVQVTLAITTESGKPATVDGKPTWEVISGESTIEVAEDGMSAFLISSDNLGDTVYQVKADADLGDGIEDIVSLITLHVIGAKAKNLGLSFGDAVPK